MLRLRSCSWRGAGLWDVPSAQLPEAHLCDEQEQARLPVLLCPGLGNPGQPGPVWGARWGSEWQGPQLSNAPSWPPTPRPPPSATHPSEGCPRALRSLRKRKAAPRNRRPAGAPPPPPLQGQTATPNVPGRRAGRGAPWAHPGRLPGVRPSETRGRGARFLWVGGAGGDAGGHRLRKRRSGASSALSLTWGSS